MDTRFLASQVGEVFPLGFGGAAVSGAAGGYGFGDIEEEEAVELLQKALEGGIVVYDTAPVYGFGRSEEVIGKAFEGRREEVVIASKCGVTYGENRRIYRDLSRQNVERMFEESCERLRTDYIDIYMIHWPEDDVEPALEYLQSLKAGGRIKAIGYCNASFDQLEPYAEIVDVAQVEINALVGGISSEYSELLADNEIGLMGWGTFAKGILAGTLTEERERKKGFDRSDLRWWAPWWKSVDRSGDYRVVRELGECLDSKGVSLRDFALEFVLRSYRDVLPLVGCRDEPQLDAVLGYLGNRIADDVYEEAVMVLCSR